MQQSMETSELLNLRLSNDLPGRHILELKEALVKKDFENFAKLTMKESNQLHAVCLDTFPPIFYMNQTSKKICNLVRDLNTPKTIAAYSIDAGFHVFVFTLKENRSKVLSRINDDVGREIERIIETSIDPDGVVKE